MLRASSRVRWAKYQNNVGSTNFDPVMMVRGGQGILGCSPSMSLGALQSGRVQLLLFFSYEWEYNSLCLPWIAGVPSKSLIAFHVKSQKARDYDFFFLMQF